MFGFKGRRKYKNLVLLEIPAVMRKHCVDVIFEGIRMRSVLTLRFFVFVLFSVVGLSLRIEVVCSGKQECWTSHQRSGFVRW